MNDLNDACMFAYRKQYPRDACGFDEGTGYMAIEHRDTVYAQPEDETNESFMERLERGRQEGRNLFYEEWPELQYPEDGQV